MDLGWTNGAVGSIWMKGGQLLAPNSFTTIGRFGTGRLTLTNGTFLTRQMFVGSNGAAVGTLTVAGGQLTVFDGLTLGNCATNATGRLLLNGGIIFVTNAAHTASLDVRKGAVIVSNGVLVVDKLVLTNACGSFVKVGGTVTFTTLQLDPALDADGDGMSNGYEQSHGLDPLNPADAGSDFDGDGFTNLQEFQAGTDPNNSASSFRITSVVSTGSNVLVTWMTGIGKTNALQWTAGAGDGGYATNSFADIFIVTNTVGTTTNYLDAGAATNSPARYYRVRLVP